MKIFVAAAFFCTILLSAEMDWLHDYKVAQEKAALSKKPIYVFITSDSCKWCRKFETTTLKDKAVLKRLYAEFELVHISRDRHSTPQIFEKSPVPRHYFTDANGTILYSSLGHRGVECFDAFMDNAQKKNKVSE